MLLSSRRGCSSFRTIECINASGSRFLSSSRILIPDDVFIVVVSNTDDVVVNNSGIILFREYFSLEC